TGTCAWTPGSVQTSTNPVFVYVSGGTSPIPAGGSTMDTFSYTPTVNAPATATVGFPNRVGTASSVNVTINAATDAVNTVSSSNGFSLEQNYPNPFGGMSQLSMTLPVGAMVHLNIIDVQGKVVETVLNQHFDAGTFGVTMSADGLSSGTYYYQMTAGDV